MLKLVILISGSGSNLQAIMDAISAGELPAEIVGVLSNREDAFGLERARQAGLPTALISHKDFDSREAFDSAMAEKIDAWRPDIVVLAGFMRILSAGFVEHYAGRLLNIHPSLLPKYKGLHTHARALEAGDAEHGCSIHFVTAELDGGPVIAQALVSVRPDDTENSLTERVHKSEHQLYPQVLRWLATGRLYWREQQPWLDSRPQAAPEQLRFENPE